MKFIETGPDVPDDLLIARDEGKVLFFCGAGVSFARAGLSGFLDLAGEVIDDLGSLDGSLARRLHDAANQPLKNGAKSYVPVDRMFTALDQEFEPVEVRNAVARALAPKKTPVDLAAHRLLLELSKGIDGRPRLVTTNFDRLFEECDPNGLRTWGPPHLPLPNRPNDFHGIIHLHGRINPSYTGISDDEVVLSSSDFGKAYLSDGWATQYIRQLIVHFKIVFVGYSADDPPVQYLLEALRDDKSAVSNIYAFQHGDEAQAREQWAQKGVRPIAFGHDYETLWKTLIAWAERAKDPVSWHDNILAKSAEGPSPHTPLHRSRVAHILSSSTGIARVRKMAAPLPATWLYVLDPNVRYLQPMRLDRLDPASAQFDPFEHFGLDGDVVPEPADPEEHYNNRKTPADAWDGLATESADIVGLLPSEAGSINIPAQLANRPWLLAAWFLGRVGELPALWWAAGLNSLHPKVISGLEHAVKYRLADNESLARCWRHLLDSWARSERRNDGGYDLQGRMQKHGWSAQLVRDVVDLHRTWVSVRRRYATRPPLERDTDVSQYIALDVEYPEPHIEFSFPPEWLPLSVGLWRDLLLQAEQQEVELGSVFLLEPTRPEDGQPIDVPLHGMTGLVVRFARLMEAWEAGDKEAASFEVKTWQSIDGLVFERLKIWAAGRSALTTAAEAGRLFLQIDDATFWSFRHERDLMLSIRDRWSDMSEDDRSAIEKRLLTSSIPYLADHDDREERTAVYRLDALQYLAERGVTFSFDLAAERSKLRLIAPQWREEHAADMGQPSVRGPFSITSDTDPSQILDAPLRELLPLPTQQWSLSDRVERDPFVGLAAKRPVRALRALHYAMDRGVPTAGYWSKFLQASKETPSNPRLDLTIITLVSRVQPSEVSRFWYPLIDWMSKRSRNLDEKDSGEFDVLWNVLLAAAMVQQPGYKQQPKRDWSFESLNSVAGRMMLALFESGLPPNDNRVPSKWLPRMEALLALPGDHRRHALYVIARRAGWLFQEEPTWTTTHVLSAAEIGHPDGDPFWAGFSALRQVPSPALLKQVIAGMLGRVAMGRSESASLASHLLSGWRTFDNEQIVSSAQMRDVLVLGDDDLRRSVLRHLAKWAENQHEWKDLILPFLERVWPKQKTTKTPEMSVALFDFAAHFPDLLPSIIRVIGSRLVPFSRGSSMRMDEQVISALDGAGLESLLDALELVLPNNRLDWPYNAKRLVEAIVVTGKLDGPRLRNLMRRAEDEDM